VAEESLDAPAAATFTGTITLTISVTLKTTGLTNITCSADVSVTDAATTSPRFISESNTVAATGTGTTRTCKLSIPYSWALTTQGSDIMSTEPTIRPISTAEYQQAGALACLGIFGTHSLPA